MTRFWPDGVAIAVVQDELAGPLAFTWEGHRHVVALVLDRWRVDQGWWRRRIWREYFKLVSQSGLLVLIYHDVRAERWYLQRVYD